MAVVEMPTEYESRYFNKQPVIVCETDWEQQHFGLLFPGGLLCLENIGCPDCVEAVMEILEQCRAESEPAEKRP